MDQMAVLIQVILLTVAYPKTFGVILVFLAQLYDGKYGRLNIGRTDFWIAAANAVIRQTSVDNALDTRDSFLWGRQDRALCPDAGNRLPTPHGCQATEDAMRRRMGLTRREVVALMGSHTLGRGDRSVSGRGGYPT